jgi:HSP20 family protein
MYTTKRNYGLLPRTFNGLMDDVIQNGWTKLNEEIIPFSVPVNILETDTAFNLQIIAPGIKKENIKINVEKGILTISNEHVDENKDNAPGKWIRNEYCTKSFSRIFTLNDNTDSTRISAKYTDGILFVTIPKNEKTSVEVKEIPVN